MSGTRVPQRMKRRKRLARLTMLLVTLTILSVGFFFAFDILYSVKQASNNVYQELNPRAEEVEITKDPFTVLLAGIEDQDGGLGRSDVLMFITVNPKTEEISLLSIPRDTRTYLPEAEYKDKINHSYSLGGIKSTISTVEKLLDIQVDYFITSNFNGFEDIVDTLGGVTVDVPFTFDAQLTGSLKWKTYYEGEMHLNGNETLAYVRMRKSDPKGDMGRNERQQQVIKAIIDKGTSFSSITKIDDILDDLGANVKTNIPPSKFASFVRLYSNLKDSQIENLKLEGYDEYIDDVYYYIPYEESIQNLNISLNNTLNGISDDEEDNIQEETNMTAHQDQS